MLSSCSLALFAAISSAFSGLFGLLPWLSVDTNDSRGPTQPALPPSSSVPPSTSSAPPATSSAPLPTSTTIQLDVFHPSTTVSNPFGCGHSYYFVQAVKTWNDAEQYCINTYNAHLVKVDSQYEHNFLVSVIASSAALNTSNYWIGGYARSSPRDWHWTCDHSSFGYGSEGHVAPWGVIQPDGDGDCAHMWLQFPEPVPWSWNDVDCQWTLVWGKPLYFICEKCGTASC